MHWKGVAKVWTGIGSFPFRLWQGTGLGDCGCGDDYDEKKRRVALQGTGLGDCGCSGGLWWKRAVGALSCWRGFVMMASCITGWFHNTNERLTIKSQVKTWSFCNEMQECILCIGHQRIWCNQHLENCMTNRVSKIPWKNICTICIKTYLLLL